jgi:hypothetical protein
MRIGCDHSVASTTSSERRVAVQQRDAGFADTLASAVEADTDTDARPPELSAATYRLFAAIDLERGDTKHAELHLSRVPDAREAGIPLQPAGVLSDVGRWDYTEAAAALPETGKFDSATGQGVGAFIPYNARPDAPKPGDCTGEPTTTATASDDDVVGRLRGAVADLEDATRGGRGTRAQSAAALAALLDTLPS